MNEGELGGAAANATTAINDEISRSHHVTDPGAGRPSLMIPHLASLKRRHEFLNEYSDAVLSSTPIDTLLKLESTSIKLRNLERGEGTDEKLSANRDNLVTTITTVVAGEDNRWSKLHASRFLPGAACSAVKLWLRAREVLEGCKVAPVAVYDMASIGMGGSVSAKGWVEIHNPSSPFLSIRMFSMNSCVSKSKAPDADFPDMEDISEFKAALRVLRGAMAFVHPRNRSVDAIESFFVQNNFCTSDISGSERQAHHLSQFCDYVLVENASRWRGMEPFLDTRALRNTWSDFISQKSITIKNKNGFNKGANNFRKGSSNQQHSQHSSNQSSSNQQQQQWFASIQPSQRYNMDPCLFKEDICVMFNLGKCLKSAGNCNSKYGKPLRHVCNFRPDINKPDVPCGQNHMSKLFH